MTERDKFSIGSAASGVSITVYFEDILDEVLTVKKIDAAISLWKKASLTSGRFKR